MPEAATLRDGDADTAAQLIGFVAELSERLSLATDRTDFLILFSLLSSLALGEPGKPFRRGALCSDGTPIEFSLSLDDRGRHALRFVCDVGGPPAAWDSSENRWYRELADKVVPPFDGRDRMLDGLFAAHLAGAPADMPFKVWFGAAAAPDVARTGLVYFNSEWLALPELAAILTSHIGADAVAIYLDLAASVGAAYAGLAYDFDTTGLRKAKLYLRLDPTRIRDLDTTLGHFPGDTRMRLAAMFEKAFGAMPVGQRGGAMLALGVSTRSASLDASAYFHLESWGVPDFAALTPVVRRLLGGWGSDFDGDLSEGPYGCAPTLLSLSTSGERERLAIYFKPQLARRPAAVLVETATVGS